MIFSILPAALLLASAFASPLSYDQDDYEHTETQTRICPQLKVADKGCIRCSFRPQFLG